MRYRYLTRYSPLTAAVRQGSFNAPYSLGYHLGGTLGPVYRLFPPINAWEGEDGLSISAELPGMNPEEIEITLDGSTLSLSGVRKEDDRSNDVRSIRSERRIGEFARSFELPFKPEADKIAAKYENGILEIFVPRLAEEKPKKIAIQSSDQ